MCSCGRRRHTQALLVLYLDMSMLDSKAVFKERCDAFGVTDAEYQRLQAKSWATFGTLAFASGWQPGQSDETGLLMIGAVFCGTGSASPPDDRMPVVRRLAWEAYTLCAADLRSRAERRDDDKPVKLQRVERVQRASDQQARLTHLALEGELEMSHALEDLVVQMYEDNALSYIPWEACTKRDQERMGVKTDPVWKPDASGVMRMAQEESNPKSNLRTDLLLQFALQRRSLAFDRARLCSYAKMERWTSKVLAAFVASPEHGYAKVGLAQLRRADARFFKELEDLTKGGIRPGADGAFPLDAAVDQALVRFEVAMALAPAQLQGGGPGSAASSNSGDASADAAAEQIKKLKEQVNKANKAKEAAAQALANERKRKAGDNPHPQPGNPGTAKKKTKKKKGNERGQPVPSQFKGGVCEDENGDRICFAFNSPGGCSTKGARCSRGVHKCMVPGCFSTGHGFHEHE